MSQRFAGCVYAVCLVDERTVFLAKCVKRFLRNNTFIPEPSVKALKMRLTAVKVSPKTAFGSRREGITKRPFSFGVIFPKDRNYLGINLDFDAEA